MYNKTRGFTLMEVLIVVLIIGILSAVAVPQYQKAVLKSRYSAMIPIGKAIASGNEAYYMEHGTYASLPTDLDVSGQSSKYPDGTQVSIPQEEESLSYVLVTNDSVPNARYLVYQKHSPNFPDTTMCEAGDERTNELCIALGGETLPGGGNSLGNTAWTAYLLTGNLRDGDKFTTSTDNGNEEDENNNSTCPDNSVCNAENEITSCTNGYTLKDGVCSVCDIENAAVCSATSYRATSCQNGLCVKDGACVSCDCTSIWCASPQLAIGAGGKCRRSGTLAEAKNCVGSSFNANAICDGGTCSSSDTYGVTTFTDTASCKEHSSCFGAEFYGNSSCADSAICISNSYTTTFTDNATCKDTARCEGSVFSGNSTCTSTFDSDGYFGCGTNQVHPSSGKPLISTFKDNAVCAGAGCQYANYEGNACCAGTSCPSGVQKCVYNSATDTYDRDGVW